MAILRQDFTGSVAPEFAHNEDKALAQLNDWRNQATEVKVLNIESMFFYGPEGRRTFYALRMWYETDH